MKNNLILLGILIALLTGTYFLQEKKDRHNYVKMNEDEVIFKGPIQEISWDHFEAKKLNRNWKHGDQLLSAIHFGKIEKSIKGLRKIKSVDGEINKIFSNPFELRINGQQFLFGNLTLQQDGFYVAQDKSIFIATFDEDILHSENENPDEKKLNEFLSLFPTDTSSLIERHVKLR